VAVLLRHCIVGFVVPVELVLVRLIGSFVQVGVQVLVQNTVGLVAVVFVGLVAVGLVRMIVVVLVAVVGFVVAVELVLV